MKAREYQLRIYMGGDGRRTCAAFANNEPISAPRPATPENLATLRAWLREKVRQAKAVSVGNAILLEESDTSI